jgi:hypothetical protein
MEITAPFPTFADYVRGVDLAVTPINAPSRGPRFGGSHGGGIDLGSLFRAWRDQMRDRETQRIRARITAELAALEAANASRPRESAEETEEDDDKKQRTEEGR